MKVKLRAKGSFELYGGELDMADIQFQKSLAKKEAKGIKKLRVGNSHFLICTPIFWTALGCLVTTICTFAFAIANSVLLAREDRNYELHTVLSSVIFPLAGSGFIHCLLHLWFGRFDNENKRQRLWLNLPLLLFFAGFIVHNVFWYLGVKFEPESFPFPNSASFSVVGFVMCFVIAFSFWYQAKYVKRLFV